MSNAMKTIYVEGTLARLLIPGLDDLTITVPSPERLAEHEADRLSPHPAVEAWCAWWIRHNGDAPMKITTPEGRVAAGSLFAFRAGWDEATK